MKNSNVMHLYATQTIELKVNDTESELIKAYLMCPISQQFSKRLRKSKMCSKRLVGKKKQQHFSHSRMLALDTNFLNSGYK